MITSSARMNEDVILEIMSHCPVTEIAKFRLLNKDLNRRSYESYFTNRHLHRTNSVFGYFIRYLHNRFKCRSSFVSAIEEEAPGETGISLDFLPSKNVMIEACDTHHGVLVCVSEKLNGRVRIPDYIVCKPATKQYRIIPNPKTRYLTIAIGLMVVQSNPFRYKIVRVSKPKTRERIKENLNCEVFDSDLFAWKRLNDLELPEDESFPISDQPVLVYGFLHWLTKRNKVLRFCMRTETWSFLNVMDDLVGDKCLSLVSYEGKLGVVNSREGEDDLWVLESSFGKSWVKVKYLKFTGCEYKYHTPLWFPSNDVVLVAGFCKLGLHNMNSDKSQHLHMKIQNCLPYYLRRDDCFPFYSNYERVSLNKDPFEETDMERRDTKKT